MPKAKLKLICKLCWISDKSRPFDFNKFNKWFDRFGDEFTCSDCMYKLEHITMKDANASHDEIFEIFEKKEVKNFNELDENICRPCLEATMKKHGLKKRWIENIMVDLDKYKVCHYCQYKFEHMIMKQNKDDKEKSENM